ncbi:hypothetical protein CBS101457_005495 [Exobasidium rhododendri]|nr:hypothetical protein CBS101457_005495 [Exobasidium rhododendri]
MARFSFICTFLVLALTAASIASGAPALPETGGLGTCEELKQLDVEREIRSGGFIISDQGIGSVNDGVNVERPNNGVVTVQVFDTPWVDYEKISVHYWQNAQAKKEGRFSRKYIKLHKSTKCYIVGSNDWLELRNVQSIRPKVPKV